MNDLHTDGGQAIGKILRRFTDDINRRGIAVDTLERQPDGSMTGTATKNGILGFPKTATLEEIERCSWEVPSYPQTLKALAKLPEFAGNKEKADAYLCGYVRGLRMMAFIWKQAA